MNFELEKLQIFQFRVKKVQVDGLSKTKDCVVKRIIDQILRANTMHEVMKFTMTAHNQLKELGCFHKVNAVIDTCNDDPDNTALQVSFNVEELPLTYINASSETGDNEVLAVPRLGLPNLHGGGEKLETTFKLGTSGTKDFRLNYIIPLRWNLLWKINQGECNSAFVASAYRQSQNMPWSNLRGTFQGISVSAELSPKSWLEQLVQYECCWRQLSPLDSPGFASRSMCGHSLKSSLVNKLTIDTLDDQSLPSNGMNVSLRQELAGIGLGNVAFFKTEISGSFFKEISRNFIFGTTFGTGNISHMIPSDDACSVRTGLPCDKFTLGGPMYVRGFKNHQLGPSDDDDHLGVNAFWRLGIHGFTKRMPFIRGDSWLARNVGVHGFADFCQGGNPHTNSYFKWLMDFNNRPRFSMGLGIIARLGEFGRAELNYCLPIQYSSSDVIVRGLQFGIGVVFS